MTVLPSRSEVRAERLTAQEPAAAMIEIDHVSQIFQTSSRQDHLALSDISLTIEDGAFVSILGPSGCGKSTLLYIVGGFVQPTRGRAKMKGRAITGPGPDRGPVFQEFALFPSKSVLGNVLLMNTRGLTSDLLLGSIPIVLLVLLWQALVSFGYAPVTLLPPPVHVLDRMLELLL